MLSAACYVALILIMGAVIFIQLEESAASERHAADQRDAESQARWLEQIERDQKQALFAARDALSQLSWMEFLPHIKDCRRLLAQIRDHFDRCPHKPFLQPYLEVVTHEVAEGSEVQVHLELKTSEGWKAIVMSKVADSFKFDWGVEPSDFDLASLRSGSPPVKP
jgi:hypothetical protein